MERLPTATTRPKRLLTLKRQTYSVLNRSKFENGVRRSKLYTEIELEASLLRHSEKPTSFNYVFVLIVLLTITEIIF